MISGNQEIPPPLLEQGQKWILLYFVMSKICAHPPHDLQCFFNVSIDQSLKVEYQKSPQQGEAAQWFILSPSIQNTKEKAPTNIPPPKKGTMTKQEPSYSDTKPHRAS